MTTKVKYESGVPATVRRYCDSHEDQIHSVDCGTRNDGWRYMAWLHAGWNCGDDYVHSVIGETAADLISRLRDIGPCECDDCRATLAKVEG